LEWVLIAEHLDRYDLVAASSPSCCKRGTNMETPVSSLG
ncbi:MAG: hypothetical protein JWN55_2628, partial [Frankiales bacterium]|nr:hypothetical protein [Frankiales bacterium]